MTAVALTAAQIAQVYSDSGRAEIYNGVLVEAVTKGQVVYQTTAGVYGLCEMDVVAKDEPRGVALQAGSAGEAISILKYGPIYGVTIAGVAYDGLVYASETAGAMDTAGTVAIGRVFGLADPSKTKVLFIDCREQPVSNGFLELAGLAYTSAGAYQDPLIDPDGGSGQVEFQALWLQMSHDTARGYGHRVFLEMVGVNSRTSNAIRAEYALNAPSGLTQAGGAAIHAAAYLGIGNTGIAGLLAGLNASLVFDAESRSLNGTYTCLSLQSEIKTGNAPPAASTSFIRAADSGAVDLPLFLDISGIGTGAGKAYDTNVNTPGADSNCKGYLRVRVAGGTTLGIPVWTLS